jgi:DNA-binding transcriptional LysR family regulator
MKLRHLRAFVTVADTGSFGGAARELNLVQAALSKQVAGLEGELGVRLFVRGPREVALTDAGVAFIEEARRIVRMSELAVSRTRAAADRAAGTLRFGYTEMLQGHEAIVASTLATLGTQHPRLTVTAVRMSSAEQWQALRDREIHVGIGYGEPDDAAQLAHQPLAHISVDGVLLPGDHPLVSRHPLHFRDLEDFPLLIFPRDVNPPLYDWLMAGLASRGLNPRTRPWMHSQTAHKVAVSAGHGWMLASAELPETSAGVAMRSVDDPPMSMVLTLWWAGAGADPSVRVFVEAAMAARGRL